MKRKFSKLTAKEDQWVRVRRAAAKTGVCCHAVYHQRDLQGGVWQCSPKNLVGFYCWSMGQQPRVPHISPTPEAAADYYLHVKEKPA